MKPALTSPFECCERTAPYAEYRHRSAIFIAHQPHDLLVLENQDFQEVFPYFQGEKEMVFLGAPYIEYGAFDPACGDVYFIQVY
ncbi:hypothetical protein ABNN50_003495 [Salmonella enterica subsp. enterica]|nr:hypothetical protein [Salmonella enterica subsp. enterica serovar Give]EEI6856332.1 hypothetical protein [Salmonella enterica subsp. enterica]EGI8941581.1 hypothetical protein [Salmonella enterica]HCM6290161.1 hypothetical protein [Salmonella enterica subsp. enterica serovar 16:l,v:-]